MILQAVGREPSEAQEQGVGQVGVPEALTHLPLLLVLQPVRGYLLWPLPALQPWHWLCPAASAVASGCSRNSKAEEQNPLIQHLPCSTPVWAHLSAHHVPLKRLLHRRDHLLHLPREMGSEFRCGHLILLHLGEWCWGQGASYRAQLTCLGSEPTLEGYTHPRRWARCPVGSDILSCSTENPMQYIQWNSTQL